MYLESKNKSECFGCEACAQVCNKSAIKMMEDEEGFRYPFIDASLCVKCGLCEKVCPAQYLPKKYDENKYVFGGYNLDKETRFESTSGGAFSAIVDAYCDENYAIFGAEAKGISIFHNYILDKRELGKFRKSKYSQSRIADSYKYAKKFLCEGKKVLFSGTPCQIAGLKNYLGSTKQDLLLTVEVVCEGVPSPLYIRKYEKSLEKKYGSLIDTLDYRYTGKSCFSNGKWDFECMRTTLADNPTILRMDRWFNPFWTIWLNHLMSRPSCYVCPFTTTGRVADITLGDLWGVHLYCPDLYGKNGGSSLVVCNTEKGKEIFQNAQRNMYGHELRFEDALKYQGPMRKAIAYNSDRESFMTDLMGEMEYEEINKKWAKKPTWKLLFQKYIYGNRQKIFLWNLRNKLKLKRNI